MDPIKGLSWDDLKTRRTIPPQLHIVAKWILAWLHIIRSVVFRLEVLYPEGMGPGGARILGYGKDGIRMSSREDGGDVKLLGWGEDETL